LEDRRVKNLIKYGNVRGESSSSPSSDVSIMYDLNSQKKNKLWLPITKKALVPSDDEISINKRSRSAKLRVAEKPDLLGNSIFDKKVKRRRRRNHPNILGMKQLAKLKLLENDVSDNSLNK
jgi:hypothetical protein